MREGSNFCKSQLGHREYVHKLWSFGIAKTHTQFVVLVGLVFFLLLFVCSEYMFQALVNKTPKYSTRAETL